MNVKMLTQRSGIVLSLLALLVYGVLVSPVVYPGPWSEALLSIRGEDPFRPLSHPLWQFLLAPLAALAGASFRMAATWVNVLLGAGVVWLTYEIALRIRVRGSRRQQDDADSLAASYIAAVVAALYVAACLPMWVISTGVHPLALDVCMLLGAVLLTFVYRDRPSLPVWLAFSFLFGAGVAEFATFILAAPFFLCWWILLFVRTKTFRVGTIVAGLTVSLVGLLTGVLFCWFYSSSPAAEWREFDNFWLVYRYYLVDLYHQLRFAVPKQGWLLIILMMILPAFLVQRFGFESADDAFTNFGLYLFRLILLAVAVIILFDLPGSPVRIVRAGMILLTPQVVVALWVGQLTGFFYRAALRKSGDRLRPFKPRPILRGIICAAALGVLAFAGYRNAVIAAPSHAAPIHDLAKDVLAHVGDHDYLLSNGSLDTAIRWQVAEQGGHLKVIDRNAAGSQAYMRMLSTWFDDPGLESLAVIGLSPFMDRWMSDETNITGRLVVQDVPDLWSNHGYRWVPHGGVYRGADLTAEDRDATRASLDDSLAFVQRHVKAFGDAAKPPVLLKDAFLACTKQLTVFANNVGYALASQERWDDARAAYVAALAYEPLNGSALVNLLEVARREGNTNDVEALSVRIEQARKRMGRVSPAQLAAQYGFMRTPAIFLGEGVAMLESGMTDQGLERIQQTLSMFGDDVSAEFSLAQGLYESGRIRESAAQFKALAEKDPSNLPILLGLARCHIALNETAAADALFQRAQSLGIPAHQLATERGFMLLRSGDLAGAIVQFEKGMDHDSTKGPAAVGTVWAGLRAKNAGATDKAVAVLKEMPGYYAGQMTLYDLAVARNDLQEAREFIQRARRIQPGNIDSLEREIQLELREGREQEARMLLDRLLALDADNAYGNYLLSGLHESEGRYDLAEAALRRALRRNARADYQYGLAWVLGKQGRDEEALATIEQAVATQPSNPQYLAVKGIILASLKRWDEAERCLEDAIRLRSDREVPLFQLHLALVYANTGRQDLAQKIVESANAKRSELTPDELEVLDLVVNM